jgi:glucosylceramidase
MKVEFVTTYGDGEQNEQKIDSLIFREDFEGVENEVINLYPDVKFQELEGFGGAITDAAGYVYSQMSGEQKRQLMETYFAPGKMKYGIVRIHMDSCDFSTEMYEAMSDKNDRELRSFSFARTEKYIIPMLKDAQRTAGRPLEIMLSPWSPPAFMKTNGERKHGGSLKPEYQDFWADYICRYIKEFEERGFVVRRISLQNEAKAVQTWDSCVYTALQEKEFLKEHMYPALMNNGLSHVEIFIWDHNKERVYDRVCQTIDDTVKHMVSGVAFHWYSGDHFEALDLVRRRFPELKMIISESCIEYRKFDANDKRKNAMRLSHEIIGDLNNGMSAFYDWNLLLDETGGPNHVGNLCHAPFLYDRIEKKLLPQLIQQHFNHFSHYIEKGAVRIGFSKYTDKLDVTAFKNPDGNIVVVFLNRNSERLPVVIRLNEEIVEFEVEAEAIVTGVIRRSTR